MPNLNKVMLMGNLTRDPELRYTPSGNAVVKFGIAINRRWRDQQTNEQREETTFVECEAWNSTAETINQYLRKTHPVFIEGRLKLDQWTDKATGQKRSKLFVAVDVFQFIEAKESEQPAASAGYSNDQF
jgi:single-strand DNA-binding protein